MSIPAALRRRVVERAKNRCEYCGLAQAGQEAAFHVDHGHPVADKGATSFANLALACVSCSLRKGARRNGIDPKTGRVAPAFHPRTGIWTEHFRWSGLRVLGLTPCGRATVALLNLNRPLALAIREEETHWQRHPPPQHKPRG
jgi:hypothetical protein